MSPDITVVQKIAVWALPVLFAITLHEVAHGWVARMLGDRTAEMLGRLTPNPLKHIDPIGTVVVPIVLLVLGGFLFGWAKPVPVNMRNLRNPRRDMAIVAIAGPAANAIMALGWGLLLKLALMQQAQEGIWIGIQAMAGAGIAINLIVGVLNLLPVLPLDGGRVLNGLLPRSLSLQYEKIERYGLVIVVVLLATGWLAKIMFWPLAIAQYLLFSSLGIHASGLF